MNKNILGTLAFSLMAMISFSACFFVVQTAIVHASPAIAVCFGTVGLVGGFAMVAVAYAIHKEGETK